MQNNNERTKSVWLIFLFIICVQTGCGQRKNVLFLMADDLRAQLGSFQNNGLVYQKIYTPHLDEFASKSMVFRQAYVQQALCGPSRTSLLTGRRPDTTHVYDAQYWRKTSGNFTTIPQYFKEHGYNAIGIGKIFHPYKGADKNDPISWSRKFHHAKKTVWEKNHTSWIAVPDSQLNHNPLVDKQIADQAVNVLEGLRRNSSFGHYPFFLAVGFHRPHLPFVFPDSVLKFYPTEDIKQPDNPYAPINLPDIAWSSYPELRGFRDIDVLQLTGNVNTTLPDFKAIELRRAYYAAVTWMDSQVGRVLGALKDSGYWNNTVVVFLGDHGWQLGEHAEWCKHTNFEISAHAPLLIRIPELTDAGIFSSKLTEFVDIFPTLVEAIGLPSVPQCPIDSSKIKVCHEGVSLMPLIISPDRQWKDVAFTQFLRSREGVDIMGYSVKTQDGFRYTEWVKFHNSPYYKADWDQVFGVELYDHSVDPEENYNLVDEITYGRTKEVLRQKLRAGWRQTLTHI